MTEHNDQDRPGTGPGRPPGGGADDRGRGPEPTGELHRAAQRLEQAVDDLARSAYGAVGNRAHRLVDDMEDSVRRLRDQITADEDPAGRPPPRSRATQGGERVVRATKRNGWLRDLYREPERGWIAGVCAGLARYYQVEPWVVRVVAFSLLIFIPGVAFWAYIIAIFVLAKRPAADAARVDHGGPRSGGASPAPELGPRLAPRHDVRTVRVRFRDLELRLRRIESHVTSREFTLAQEFSALETKDGKGGRADV